MVFAAPPFPLVPRARGGAATLLAILVGACAPATEATLAPETHTWKQEGELVVEGLEEVESLWKAGNKDAARVLVERVYTERWEPRLEEAARRMDGNGPVIETEYAFSLLMVELQGNGRDIERKVHDLQEKSRAIADAAARTFPPPASAGLPAPAAAATDGSKPIVPDVRPAWEAEGG
ncbi:MAG: hypothetical protein Q8P41_25255 [Pseudomonadota bacterium]|nr:hypothetical protein [Pseudomonadota bacterium]